MNAGYQQHEKVTLDSVLDANLAQAEAQREFVTGPNLPTTCRGREALEAAGVRFGALLASDPLFCTAVLPAGWTKRATKRPLWSELVDERGRVRARVFFRIGEYTRKADMQAVARFGVDVDTSDLESAKAFVTDGGTRAHFESERFKRAPAPPPGKDASALARAAAEAWLDARYPKWRYLSAYWDEPAAPSEGS